MSTRRPLFSLGQRRFGQTAALWTLLAACEPPPVQPPPLPTLGELAIGTIAPERFGDSRWVDLAGGQDLQLTPGAQGGFHLWVKVRIKNLSGRVRMHRIAERVGLGGERQRVLTAPETLVELPGTDLWETPEPIPSFMCPTPIGISVLDAPIELTVWVESTELPAKTLGTATVRVWARCPPPEDLTRPFCLQICDG